MKKWLKHNILWLALLALALAVGFHLGKNKSAAEANPPITPTMTVIHYTPLSGPQPSVTPLVVEPEPEPEVEWETYIATAYCPCEKCCGKYAKNRPNGIVYTGSGEIAKEGTTIAADWAVLEPGTEVEIDGIGVRTVHDKGSAIKGNRIDIYYESHKEALNFGIQEVQLRVLDKKESP